MREISARRLAWEVIYQVTFEGGYSNLLLPQRLRESQLQVRDRGFATELTYGVLRMQGLCDAYISRVSDRAIADIDAKTLIGLRIGVYQLKILQTPDHAAINETVNLVKETAGKSAGSFANAVLRNVAAVPESAIDSWELLSHPKWIVNVFKDVLKDEASVLAQLQADNEATSPTLIAWPGRSTVAELVEAGAIPIEGSRYAATFEGNPGEIPAIKERRAGVQDLGSQLVVENFFATGFGEDLRWLDLCAGPGGKAAYLDSLIDRGEFVANEPREERVKLVEQVVSRGRVTNFDGRNIPDSIGSFERILVDAPCTGLGALRRRPEVRWRRRAEDLRALVELQHQLLEGAVGAISKGGIIGYATCSPHLAETKFQVRDFLKRHPNFKRVPVEKYPDKDGDMQLWTFRDGTDSMYLSLLRREE